MDGDRDCRVAPPDPGVARISDELFKSFQGAVGLLRDAVQRRNFLPGQSQRPPEERCKAVYAGKSCEGDSQFLTDPNRCMRAVRLRIDSLLPLPAIAGPSLGWMGTACPYYPPSFMAASARRWSLSSSMARRIHSASSPSGANRRALSCKFVRTRAGKARSASNPLTGSLSLRTWGSSFRSWDVPLAVAQVEDETFARCGEWHPCWPIASTLAPAAMVRGMVRLYASRQ